MCSTISETVKKAEKREDLNQLFLVVQFGQIVLIIFLLVYKKRKVSSQILQSVVQYGVLCCFLESYLQEQQQVLILTGYFLFFFIVVFQMNKGSQHNILLFLLILVNQTQYAISKYMDILSLINFFFLQIACLLLSFQINYKIQKCYSYLYHYSNCSVKSGDKLNRFYENLKDRENYEAGQSRQDNQIKYNNNFDMSFINEKNLDQSSIIQLNIHKKYEENSIMLKQLQIIDHSNIDIKKNEPSIITVNKFYQKDDQYQQSDVDIKLNEGLLLKSLNFISTGLAIFDQNKTLVFYNKQIKKHLQILDNTSQITNKLLSLNLSLTEKTSSQQQQSQTYRSQVRTSSVKLADNNSQFPKINESAQEGEEELENQFVPYKQLSKRRMSDSQTQSFSPSKRKDLEQEQNIAKSIRCINGESNQINQKFIANRLSQSNIPNTNIAFNHPNKQVNNQIDNKTFLRKPTHNKISESPPSTQEQKQLSSEQFTKKTNSNNQLQAQIKARNNHARISIQNKMITNSKIYKNEQSTSCSFHSNKKGTLKSCSLISTNKTLFDHLKSNRFSRQTDNNLNDSNKQYVQCIISNSIDKLFQINQLVLEDVINYLLKNTESSHLKKFNTDHIIYQENEEEESQKNDSHSSLGLESKHSEISNNIQNASNHDNSKVDEGGKTNPKKTNTEKLQSAYSKNFKSLEERNFSEKQQSSHLKQKSYQQFPYLNQKVLNNNTAQQLEQFNQEIKKNQKQISDQIPQIFTTGDSKNQEEQKPKKIKELNLKIQINNQQSVENLEFYSPTINYRKSNKFISLLPASQQRQEYEDNKINNNNNNSNISSQTKKKEPKLKGEQSTQQYQYFLLNNNLHVVVGIKQSFFEIVLSCFENKEDDKEKYVILEFTDITILKRQIDNENLKRYKQKILQSISHELRTPLNCSIQMLEILSQNEEISSSLKDIFIFPALYSNQLLLNIINDILDLAQIDYGQFKMNFESFELEKICIECLNLFSIQSIQKKITLDLEFDLSIPKSINSDSNRLRQVLLNLLSNALKFTQRGKIQLKAYLIDENLIQLDVEDSGCGIPQDNLKKIIGQFNKPITEEQDEFSDLSQKSQSTLGAGLGLTIANNLAAGLGGNRGLKVSSTLNKGSVFSFFIVNHPITKKGCSYKQTDLFNKQIINWEYFSEQSIPLTNTKYDDKTKAFRFSILSSQIPPRQQESSNTLLKMKTPTSLSQINENIIPHTLKNNNNNHNDQRKNSISLSLINESQQYQTIQNNLNISFSKFQHTYDTFQQMHSRRGSAFGKESDYKSIQCPSDCSFKVRNQYTISCSQVPNLSSGIQSETKQNLYSSKRKSTSSQTNSHRQNSIATYIHLQDLNNDVQFSLSSKNTEGDLMKIPTNKDFNHRGCSSTVLTISNDNQDPINEIQQSFTGFKFHDFGVSEQKSIIQLPSKSYQNLGVQLLPEKINQEDSTFEQKQVLNLQNIISKSGNPNILERKRNSLTVFNKRVSPLTDNSQSQLAFLSTINRIQEEIIDEIQSDDQDESCILNCESKQKNYPNSLMFQQVSLKRNSQNHLKCSLFSNSQLVSSVNNLGILDNKQQNTIIIQDEQIQKGILINGQDEQQIDELKESQSQQMENYPLFPSSFQKLNESSLTLDQEQNLIYDNNSLQQEKNQTKSTATNTFYQKTKLFESTAASVQSVKSVKQNQPSSNQELSEQHLFAQNNNNLQQDKNQTKITSTNTVHQKTKQLESTAASVQSVKSVKQNQSSSSPNQEFSEQHQLAQNKIYLQYQNKSNQQQQDINKGNTNTILSIKDKFIQLNNQKQCKCSNILIVDDNEFNIYALEVRLSQYKFIISKATSGEAAIQFVKSKFTNNCCKLFDIIFMDIDMPIKNGYETTVEILAFFKSQHLTKPTPISACTAFVQESEKEKATQSGMSYYITKPINQQQLENVLNTAILLK